MTTTFDPEFSVFFATTLADTLNLMPGQLNGAINGLAALAGDDLIIGSDASELINGNQGNDSIAGRGGDDFLLGGQGNDLLQGDDGNDTLSGNLGSDAMAGGNGNDLIFGGQGDDLLLGGFGNDTLSGDKGRDLLSGDLDPGDIGALSEGIPPMNILLDLTSGTRGADVFILSNDPDAVTPIQADVIIDFGVGIDQIQLPNGLSVADISLELFSVNNIGDVPTGLRGLQNGTLISVPSSGAILGYVANRTPEQVSGSFITII